MSSNQTTTPWSDEHIADLTKLYAEGYSARAIGEKLGFSRNAIIGKARRLGLAPPESKRPVMRKGRELGARKHVERRTISRIVAGGNYSLKVIKTTEAVEQFKLRCVEVEPQHVSLDDLTGCKYPYGDGPFTFCNHPKLEDSSYCGPHFHLCRELPRKLTDKIFVRAA